jgi:hypothetical protein
MCENRTQMTRIERIYKKEFSFMFFVSWEYKSAVSQWYSIYSPFITLYSILSLGEG